MGERPQGADKRDANPLWPHFSHSNRLWRSWRHAKLKLLGALRGEGALVWSGGAITATYELDVFARGGSQKVSGQVEGDFSSLVDRTGVGETPRGSRLRLADGREIEIDLVSLEPTAADFDGFDTERASLLPGGADA